MICPRYPPPSALTPPPSYLLLLHFPPSSSSSLLLPPSLYLVSIVQRALTVSFLCLTFSCIFIIIIAFSIFFFGGFFFDFFWFRFSPFYKTNIPPIHPTIQQYQHQLSGEEERIRFSKNKREEQLSTKQGKETRLENRITFYTFWVDIQKYFACLHNATVEAAKQSD